MGGSVRGVSGACDRCVHVGVGNGRDLYFLAVN
jgi:hypothetical protein